MPVISCFLLRAPGTEYIQVSSGDLPVLERRAPADHVADLPAGGDRELSKQGRGLGELAEVTQTREGMPSADTRFLLKDLSSRANHVLEASSSY